MVAYKNFWSLNTDEAVVTGILRENTSKETDVLMPINAQMKDIDLILMNFKNKKIITIQVKGSKAYEPKKNEVKKYGEGSTGWFFLKKDIIHRSNADYFIFLVYVISENSKNGRRYIEPHTITIPTNKLKEFCLKYKKPHPDRYSFYFWVNPKKKIAFDWRDEQYDLTPYLDKKGFEELNKILYKK
ncbi:hypothetical protein CO153_02575 [Candidatus Pacearchaeota archaeon CG_4_9_14_3_um_filter_30_11]|nr:MAG: hypothetical protein COV77_01635 [Candidatus Pacearchaeota archaeon CG11_big_fil_rev_8_21_14_0_20_30_13]PIZ82356.1 MAG: hypothetical protein COX98_00090 [Candidatus Pacearchaeota archaeon CG_4_10_14_0_2_um_filter_30_11]PJA71255.1 MAG: hypothetical protein CO153_02575 [Candidatus Pacearchaeota archaeon CG_4_9_14_3_um_filter_30_11]